MRANRSARERALADEAAGTETIGAVLLFGLFVGVVAVLNVTAVPQAGLENEVGHHEAVVNALNGLQASAEGAGNPGQEGATVSASIPLAPPKSVGSDFFSFFMATPARAAGELTFEADYGNLTLLHYKAGDATSVVDIGSLASRLPLGRLTFNQHPHFREQGTLTLENGAVIASDPSGETARFAPAITLSRSGSDTLLTVKARTLTGPDVNLGGTADVRVGFETEAATLTAPLANNAEQVVLRVETAHGSAWGAYLNATATSAGLASPAGYETGVSPGAGEGGLDVVTWTIHGAGSGNDIRLTSGFAAYALRLT